MLFLSSLRRAFSVTRREDLQHGKLQDFSSPSSLVSFLEIATASKPHFFLATVSVF
jgi:hypothetical protein